MKKHLPLSMALYVAIVLSSITKLNAQNTQSSSTKYGIQPSKLTMDSKLVASNNLGVNYVRATQLLSCWDGIKNPVIAYWLSRKKKIVLNINSDSTPCYFPANLAAYKLKLQSFLDVYGDSIELAVIENEELDDSTSLSLAHKGSMQSYINELTAAVNICRARNIPITNGGFTSQIVTSLWHYYQVNNKQDSVQWLVHQMNGVLTDPMRWKRADSLLNAYKNLPLSYVNLHWYEPKQGLTRMTGVLKVICNYITQQTGKKVITNETGIKNDSSFVTMLLKTWDTVRPAYCIFFDGTGNFGGLPLTSSSGTLLPSGMAFRDYVSGGKACTKSITVLPAGFVNSCNGSSITLTATKGFTNYLWSTGQTTQTITVKGTGNFSVKSSQKTCNSYSNSAAVMMYALPPKPTITPNPSPPINICPGKPVQLLSSFARTYLWSTGETTKNVTVTNPGNYTVSIYDVNGCKSTSTTTAVTHQPCSPASNLKITGISINKATLTWSPVSCAKGYQVQYRIKGIIPWTTSQLTNGVTSSKTIYGLTAAIYQWRMLTYCNYSPDTIKSVYVYGPEFTILTQKNESNSIAANLNGFNVKLYPVPARNVATVSVSHPSNDLKIMLTDVYGKVLWQSEKITSSLTSLPVSGLAGGTYIVVVKDKEQSKMLWLIKN